MLEKMEARIKEIEEAITRSLANHNVLIGSLNEAKYTLEIMNSLPLDGQVKLCDVIEIMDDASL